MTAQLSLDLKSLSVEALQKLMQDAKAAIEAQAKIEKLRADLTALIEAEGLTVADVFPPVAAPVRDLPHDLPVRRGRKPGAQTGRKPVGDAKYENPTDPSQRWTGKGRKPFWVSEALAAGTTLDALAIKQA